jgi:hypothetical protein
MNTSPEALQAIAALRGLIWTRGFRPMPIYSADHADRARAGKAPLGNEWEKRARQDPPECIRLGAAVDWATNTGVLCDGLRAIDLDIDDPGIAGAIRALAITMLGSTIIRTRENSPRCLLVYRAAEGEPVKLAVVGSSHTKDAACKVEVLGRGQQFVAYGAHPSGAELQWLDGGPADQDLDATPAITEERLRAFMNAAAAAIDAKPLPEPRQRTAGNGVAGSGHYDHEAGPVELRDIAAALQIIPNDQPADWEEWNKIGLAIFAATLGTEAGRDLWLGWSAKHPDYDEDHALKRWEHYPSSPPDRTGAGKLFAMAGSASPGWRRPSLVGRKMNGNGSYHEPEPGPQPGWDRDVPPPEPDPGEEVDDGIRITQGTSRPISAIPPRPWAYGRFLLFGSAAVIGAMDGAGKGFISIAMALSFITGRPLLGEKVWRAGPVAIITYEDDQEEWERRIAGACIHYELDYEETIGSFYFIHKDRGKITLAERMGRNGTLGFPSTSGIVRYLRQHGIALLIIDPFNSAHTLEDGNNNVAIAAVAQEITSIAQQSRCAVLLLHHLRKGASGGVDDLMGAVALRANFRACRILQVCSAEMAEQLGIPPDEAYRYLCVVGSKENYAPPLADRMWFRKLSVTLGNPSEDYPEGDSVAAIVPWKPPGLFEGLDLFRLKRVFEILSMRPHAKSSRAKDIPWVGQPLMDQGRSPDQAKTIINQWLQSETLVPGEDAESEHRNPVKTLVPNPIKVAEILASMRVPDRPDEGFD